MKKIYKVKVEGKTYEVELEEVTTVEGNVTSNATMAAPAQNNVATSSESISINAPMPGTIIDVKVNVGDTVTRGQVIAVIEAMKMETEILSDAEGKVTSVNVTKGGSVNLDDLIVTIN